MATDALIMRVGKLKDKADAFGVTQGEAEALTAKAAAIMAREHITQAMIDKAKADAEAKAGEGKKPGDMRIDIIPPFHNQKKDMLLRIGNAMSLHPIFHQTRPGPPGYRYALAVELFGSPKEIDACHDMYRWQLEQATRLLATSLPAGAGSAYKQSWLNGYSAAIARRIREEYAQASYTYDTEHALTGAKSSALVVKAWSEKVLEYRDAKYPVLTSGKPRKSSGNGFGAGYAAGEQATLKKNSIEGNSARQIAAAS
jgi:hypothetical protein